MLLTHMFSAGGVCGGSSDPATVPQKAPSAPKRSVFSGWLTRQLSQRKSRAVRPVEALESEDKVEAKTLPASGTLSPQSKIPSFAG